MMQGWNAPSSRQKVSRKVYPKCVKYFVAKAVGSVYVPPVRPLMTLTEVPLTQTLPAIQGSTATSLVWA